MVAIIDYGVGNLFSLQSSLSAIGQEAAVTSDPETIRRADRLLLPGVGAFRDAAEKLRASGMDRAVKEAAEAGKPLLGICLGMQMLFERSYEYGVYEGLRRPRSAEGRNPADRGSDPRGAEDSPDGLEQPEDCEGLAFTEKYPGRGVRLLCPLLQCRRL